MTEPFALKWRNLGMTTPNVRPDTADVGWDTPKRLNLETIRLDLLKRHPALVAAVLEVADIFDFADLTSSLHRIKPLARFYSPLSKNYVHGRDDVNKSGWSMGGACWPLDDDFAALLYATVADSDDYVPDPRSLYECGQWTVVVTASPTLTIQPLRPRT